MVFRVSGSLLFSICRSVYYEEAGRAFGQVCQCLSIQTKATALLQSCHSAWQTRGLKPWRARGDVPEMVKRQSQSSGSHWTHHLCPWKRALNLFRRLEDLSISASQRHVAEVLAVKRDVETYSIIQCIAVDGRDDYAWLVNCFRDCKSAWNRTHMEHDTRLL